MNRGERWIAVGIIVVPLLAVGVGLLFFSDILLSQIWLGWATWLGLLVAVVGLPLALWGVVVAVGEARKAAAAASAAQAAVQSLRTYADATGLAYENAQLQAVHRALSNGSFEVAEAIFLTVKRSLSLYAAGTEVESSAFKRAIAAVDTQIGHARTGSASYRPRRAALAIQGLIRHVTQWESRIKSATEARIGSNADS